MSQSKRRPQGVSLSSEVGKPSWRRGEASGARGAVAVPGRGAARGLCPGRVPVDGPPEEGAGRVRGRARSPPVLRPRPGRLHPPAAPLGSPKLRPLPGVGSFPPTLCRQGHSCSWVGVLPLPVRPYPELTWSPRPPLRPPGHSPDPKMSARPLLARALPRLSLQCRGPAPASAAPAPARRAPARTTDPVRPSDFLACNFKLSRFSKTTTTDCLREPWKGRVGVPWGRARSGLIQP